MKLFHSDSQDSQMQQALSSERCACELVEQESSEYAKSSSNENQPIFRELPSSERLFAVDLLDGWVRP